MSIIGQFIAIKLTSSKLICDISGITDCIDSFKELLEVIKILMMSPVYITKFVCTFFSKCIIFFTSIYQRFIANLDVVSETITCISSVLLINDFVCRV